MATFNGSEDGLESDPGLSLTKAMEDASDHSWIESEDLEDKEKTLSILERELSDIEKKVAMAERELRSQRREILLLEDELDPQRVKDLRDRCESISKENAELQILISEHQEHDRMAEERFNAYRKKMEDHKAAVLLAAGQTEAQKELEEKKALVRMLRQKKEEMKKDLEKPRQHAVQTAELEKENDALKREISFKRTVIAERREQLQKERETHDQIKKDIEIQNKRYEAIVKRLHCQLFRAQAARRYMLGEIKHMKRQLAELRRMEAAASGGW